MGKHKYVKEMCNVRNIAIHSEEEGAETMGAELFGVVTTSVDENKLLRESEEDFGRRKSASQRLVVR